MALIKELDYGTPHRASTDQPVTLEIDGRGHRAGRHVGDARRDRARHRRCRSSAPPTPGAVRLLPPLPRRDRRRRGTPASCTTPVEPA